MHMNAKHSKLALGAIALLMVAALGGCGKGAGTSEKDYEAIVYEGTAHPHPLTQDEWTAAVAKWRSNFRADPTKGLAVDLACSDMRRPLIKSVRQAESRADKKAREAELRAFWDAHGEIKAKCLIATLPHRYMPAGWENDEGLAAAVKEWKRGREERIANEKKGDYD
jgi:hypothetical protein